MTQFKINNATTKIGKTVTLKFRLRADGIEGAFKATVLWDAGILQFKGMRLVGPPTASLGTNESNIAGGQVVILVNPVPYPFEKTKGFADIVELTFEAVASGKSPVKFGGEPFHHANNVSHITSGALLKAKWTDGRVTVKAK